MGKRVERIAAARRLARDMAAGMVLSVVASSAFAQSIPTGRYECWYFTRPLPGLNFTLMSGGRYTDADGNPGSYNVAGGGIGFSGGALDGQHGVYRGGTPPTIGIMGTGGRETESCQLAQ